MSVEEVQEHQSNGDLWLVIDGKVYDVSDFMDEHPGGSDILMDVAGTVGWHSPLHSWYFAFVDVLAHAVALSTLPTLRTWRWRWGHQESTHPTSTSTSCVLQQLPRFDVNHLANPLGWGACQRCQHWTDLKTLATQRQHVDRWMRCLLGTCRARW